MRPWAFGDIWDRMSTDERRRAHLSDWVVALIGAFLMALLGWWVS